MKIVYSRTIYIVCIVCISYISPGQVTDDFSDGNFTENPVWTGDGAQFEINDLSQLHLRSAGTDTSVLATPNARVKNTQWSFWMKLSFNTSSNNHARVYLTADTSGLQSQVNGCFIQVGGADDSICIMKQTGDIIEKMFSFKSFKTAHSTNIIRVKIISGEDGTWEALIDTTGGFNYHFEGSFFDDSFQFSRWFGILCRYTSSNATKFYFDDFYVGPIIQDTLPPKIVSQEVLTETTIRLTFTEAIQRQSAEIPGNYQIISTGARPDSARLEIHQPAAVTLFFNEVMAEAQPDSLRIQNIRDESGNRMPDTIVPVCYYRPKPYDILIHEIMADPEPQVELPNGEFIELYNRTEFPINLKDWSIKYGSYSKAFNALILPPKGYLLIVKDSSYTNYANCAVIFTSSSSLSNEGTTLVLKDSQGHVIHAVSYAPEWYRGSFKEKGGWSLEMIDPMNPCGCRENWNASKDASGGTPGRGNSIFSSNSDVVDPYPGRAVISDSSILTVYFSEAMDSISLLGMTNWMISPFADFPDGEVRPVKVTPGPPDFISTQLRINEVFERGVTYLLHVSGNLKDCAGNRCDSVVSIRFAIPDTVSCHDIIINEILTDPASGGSRFVELYNRSEKIIDMRSMVLSNSDTTGGLLPNSEPLMSAGYLLFPGDYIALTSNPGDICERYRSPAPEDVVGMSEFPTFGDDTGTVILARKDDLAIIDKMRYDPEMHYPLLSTKEGVSLERANSEMPSGDKNNWHSAAETVGFATPAYQNSQKFTSGGEDQEITITPDIFSPDNDGRDDLLHIALSKNEPDCAVNISIYDSGGRLARQLANHVLSGSEGIFIWDGMTDSRSKAPLGFYILLIEISRPDGMVRKIKKTAILGGKL